MRCRRPFSQWRLIRVEWDVIVPTKVVIIIHAKPSVDIIIVVWIVDWSAKQHSPSTIPKTYSHRQQATIYGPLTFLISRAVLKIDGVGSCRRWGCVQLFDFLAHLRQKQRSEERRVGKRGLVHVR